MFPQVSQAFPISLKTLGNQDKTPALWVPEKNHIFWKKQVLGIFNIREVWTLSHSDRQDLKEFV